LRSVGGALGTMILAPSYASASTPASFAQACSAAAGESSFWRLVRSQFLLPQDYAYLNTGGLGASPYMVTDKVKRMMDSEETYPDAGHKMDDWLEIKSKCAPYFGSGCKKEELAFTSTATEGINIVINGLPMARGDEVIISTHEHVALKIPLLHKMQKDGIVIRTFDPDLKRGLGNVERIEHLINTRTRLIFISHITCTTGQIMPVREIGELAELKGIWFALDGAQALAQMPVDVKGIKADFYAVSCHKWMMGPKRTGILYVREGMLDTLSPTVVGAYSDSMNELAERRLELHPTAQRYEYGTQNDALLYGLREAADFVSIISVERIWSYDRDLAERFYRGLQELPGVEVLTPEEEQYRSAMITFRFKDRANRSLSHELTRRRLRVRDVSEAHLDGIRVSFHVYNNEEEVERLLSEVGKMARTAV